MNLDQLVNLHSNLFGYFKAFGLWSGNNELMASCRAISKKPVRDQNDATAVIMGVLWKKLQGHKMRVVK